LERGARLCCWLSTASIAFELVALWIFSYVTSIPAINGLSYCAYRVHAPMKVFGFAGWSGSGKTALLEQLIPQFVTHGLTVSLIKQAHQAFDIDTPGKDSYRHREAGCKEVLVSSEKRWVLMHEIRGDVAPPLEEQMKHLAPCDLLLIEGYKRYPMPKLEIYRKMNGKPLLYPEDRHIVGIASDARVATKLPQFDLGDHEKIADFILRYHGFR
jgi:molybdopterin-guanine dinucleotide biosynthesis protein B